jgi:DNA-binding HxlR family transcriptional regulator
MHPVPETLKVLGKKWLAYIYTDLSNYCPKMQFAEEQF